MASLVGGYTSDGNSIKRKPVTIRVTSNRLGETLSLEDGTTLIGVSVEEIECEIKRARKGRNNGR